ncbi:hypothetical protein BRADI_1g51985v3 [Brachypodium distachyon]|uniref:Zinc finger GRF-type domain-containing protein n=1 Tax=Brachypodium distachyon TaxID=15368 RepID=A0A2K2DR15_BRADI|nr:hypothetical protein BRADI_1g51985v3 [Brachypodium distachyon]
MSRVSLEGKSTGRRFFGCPFEEMEDCGYVYWIDPKWPAYMENALSELWGRVESTPYFSAQDVMFMVQDLKKLSAEKSKAVDEKMKLELKIVDMVHEMSRLQSRKGGHFFAGCRNMKIGS